MMDSNLVRDPSLRQRNDRSANDGHNHDAGAIARKRSEFRYTQRENTREHDGVEETNQDNAPHRHWARA